MLNKKNARCCNKTALPGAVPGILVQQTENVQHGRQLRFTSADEIVRLRTVIKSYVREAIAIGASGVKIEHKKTTDFKVPEEFRSRLEKDKTLKAAFDQLTPGRKNAYLLHFSSAKQAKTRESRIEKNITRIMAGKGLDD